MFFFFQAVFQPKVTSFVVMIFFFIKEKSACNQKVFRFCFWATLFNFLLIKAKYQTQLVELPKCKRHLHTAKVVSSSEHICKNVNYYGKLNPLG